ncbi:rod shape-determining protein MreC [Coxiella endosymbiont of Amblyomma nuttalli]|uniref:rod shape-determining protein MreC n=1 Tax=Coxiella endosymbiont of Amblyomma nuttalli TaxID=2749996 RepID=UPI001BA91B1F|nr:rod shape-determining protein MreC [Coxiella endosymbiont of Amblyomma nuttalli]QTS83660.1 Cell shape-determining protein MreC [Coxiella endosymbiont of Amblyomma nuttalli]
MPGLRTLIYVGLAITLLVLDQKAAFFQKTRAYLAFIVLPMQYLVNAPIKTLHWIATSITTQEQLIDDNTRLRAHELLLESKLQKLLALERENSQLRELLKSTSYVNNTRITIAQLLAVNLDPNLQQIIVDKGMRYHIYIGQPVLDAYGIVGQVVHVGPLASKIMLISDPKSAVPVQDYRNGIRAIAVGMGNSEKLVLINIPDTSDIQKGDLFVSSGLGLHYPIGYPVGIVSEIGHSSSKRFATIILQRSAHLEQLQQVLMAWPSKRASLAKAVQEELESNLTPVSKEHGK